MPNADNERTCFVIGPIGKEGTDVRRRADQLFKHIIKRATEQNGFTLTERADHIDSSGIISSEIINRLMSADFVVADLTDENPNVYYELAFRHIAKLPFAHLLPVGQNPPFDISSNRAIFFDLQDPDSVEEAREHLAALINVELQRDRDEIETPFTVALDRQTLTQSTTGTEVENIGRTVARIERSLKDMASQMAMASASSAGGQSEGPLRRGRLRRAMEETMDRMMTEHLRALGYYDVFVHTQEIVPNHMSVTLTGADAEDALPAAWEFFETKNFDGTVTIGRKPLDGE